MTLEEFDAEKRGSFGELCGLDEAGRGPLCGPVCAGCALLLPGRVLPGVNDSKKLTEKKREAVYADILSGGVCWGVGWASPAEIDEINILNASLLAMRRAYDAMLGAFPQARPALALVDGNRAPALPLPVQTVVGGDGKSACIAAASVLAKVSRDRYMRELDKKYPQYKLAQHKGYPTKLHYQLIEQYGVCEIYRRTFLKGIV